MRLNGDLLAWAQELAARTGRTLDQVIEEALRLSLSVSKKARRRRARLPTIRGDGLQPGVDIDDTAG